MHGPNEPLLAADPMLASLRRAREAFALMRDAVEAAGRVPVALREPVELLAAEALDTARRELARISAAPGTRPLPASAAAECSAPDARLPLPPRVPNIPAVQREAIPPAALTPVVPADDER